MTAMLPQTAQAEYRMARAEQAAERYRVRRNTSRTQARSVGSRGSTRPAQPASRLVSGAAASSAFATGRG